MAGDEIYIARFGVWVARALGASGEFATDLDTDGLGVRMPAAVAAHPAVKAAGAVVGDAAGLVTQAADALDGAITSGDEGELFVALSKLAEGLYEFFDAAGALVAQIEARAGTISDAAERQAVQAFVVRMARAIVDYLVISLLELSRPRLVFLLKLLGLIDWEVVEPDPADPLSRQHVKKALRLERAPDLFTDPAGHFGNAFGWGTASFDPMAFFRTAAGFFPENATLDIGAVGGDAFIERRPFRWSRDSSVNPPGLMLDVTAALSQAISGRAEFSPEWGAALEATLAVESGLIARVRPPGVVTVEPKAGAVSGELEVKVDRNESARPFTIIGGNSLVSLSAEDVGVGAGVVVGAGTATGVSVEPMLFAAMTGLVLRLGSEGADSFLGSLLADADIEGRFDIGLEWRLSEGLVVRAAGGLEIAIPMHQSLGFVDLETLYVMLRDQRRRVVHARDVGRDHRQPGPADRRPSSGSARSSTLRFVRGRGRDVRPARRWASVSSRPPASASRSTPASSRGGGYRLPRLREGRVRRRARARLRRVPGVEGDRPDHHQDARRLGGLLAADHRDGRVRHPAPARLRLHADRCRRAARDSTAR